MNGASGATRVVTVGRVKVERRQLVMVEAEAVVSFVDDAVRIVRVGENGDQIFVYTKMADIM